MLKQNKFTFIHKTIVNIYIVYEIYLWSLKRGFDFTSANFLLGAVKTKNVDFDKYKYSSYRIGFDMDGTFSFSNGSGFGKNVITFGVYMSPSVDIDNKKKDILILGKGPTQGLNDTTLTAEKEYAINFKEQQKKF